MSRQAEQTLLVPGRSGWQVWKGSDTGFILNSDTEYQFASEIERLPKTGVTLAFPVRRATALPLRTPTPDAELHRDLAEVHAEQMGFRPEAGAGELFDVFPVESFEDGAVLLPVVLAAPEPGTMPLRTPGQFDISPRLYDVPERVVAVWEEFGRWVFAFSKKGEILYFQGLTEGLLNDSAAREILLAIAQLGLQGCEPEIDQVVIWREPGFENYIIPEDFAQAFSIPVSAAVKPEPRLPGRISGLLPDDVVAARYEKARARNLKFSIAAVVLALLGLVGYAGYNLWNVQKEAEFAQQESKSLAPEAAKLAAFNQQWLELGPLVEQETNPMELLYRCLSAIPPKNGGVRLKQADIDGNDVIRLQGEGEKLEAVNKFNLQLKRSNQLQEYDWETPAPSRTKNGRWGFIFVGTPKGFQAGQG